MSGKSFTDLQDSQIDVLNRVNLSKRSDDVS